MVKPMFKEPKLIDKVAWVQILDSRILCARSHGRSRFYIPGGKREAGESDIEVLAREIAEELSVSIDRSTARFLGVFTAQADAHPSGIAVCMRCYEAAYSGELQPAAEIEAMAWLRYEERPLTSPVDHLVFDELRRLGRL